MEVRIAFQRYGNFLFSKKSILLLYALVFFWEDIVQRIGQVAGQGECKAGFLEPYLLMLTSADHIMLIPLLFLVLLSDFPDKGGKVIPVLSRTGKGKWQSGQVLCLGFFALTYLCSFLIVSAVGLGKQASFLTEWSDFTNALYVRFPELFGRNNQLFLSTEVVAQGTPVMVLIHSSLLVLLFLLMLGQIVFLFHIMNRRFFGFAAAILLTTAGWGVTKLNLDIKWLFPVSHVLYGEHFQTFLSQLHCSIWLSYGYFILWNIVLFVCGRKQIERCRIW